MPYVEQHERNQLDAAVENLLIAVAKLTDENGKAVIAGPGVYNYIITSLLAVPYGYHTNYSKINEAVGILECVKQEYYRRVASPYEDVKLRVNGDVYPQMSVEVESNH